MQGGKSNRGMCSVDEIWSLAEKLSWENEMDEEWKKYQ